MLIRRKACQLLTRNFSDSNSNMAGYDFAMINTLDALQQSIQKYPALLIWFSGPDCNVCHDLKPKVATLIAESFPRITLQEVDCALSRETAAQHQVFTIPTMLIFFDGAEFIRKSRNFSLKQLQMELERPYHLLFN